MHVQGIWGNGMHQQRISNLASDLPAVKTTAPSTAASESSAHASTPAAQGREVVPSSSRSAGSTPCAREQLPGRGYSPFDGPAPFQKPRQRMTHNASAQELSQPGGNMEGPARRERAPKLSLDSLTSQRPAEQAQRQQALANFDLQAEDFPALGGGKTSGALTPVTSLGQGRAAPGKAWSETDAVSPPLKISSVQK